MSAEPFNDFHIRHVNKQDVIPFHKNRIQLSSLTEVHACIIINKSNDRQSHRETDGKTKAKSHSDEPVNKFFSNSDSLFQIQTQTQKINTNKCQQIIHSAIKLYSSESGYFQ